VLGAGASSEFNFPIGWGLLRAVVDDFNIGLQNRKTLKDHFPFSDVQIDSFRTALDLSGENSVDAFLEKRRDFMELGKLMTAIVLIGLEKTSKLFEGSAGENWMRYLLGRMRAPSFQDFHKNEVAFITFNYDRSLEHFLCTTLASAYGKTEVEAGEVVKGIPIIHLHGQLGYLPWQQKADNRAYDTKIDKDILEMCIREIKVIHEGVEDRKAQLMRRKDYFMYRIGHILWVWDLTMSIWKDWRFSSWPITKRGRQRLVLQIWSSLRLQKNILAS
jgi:hypothetical protein